MSSSTSARCSIRGSGPPPSPHGRQIPRDRRGGGAARRMTPSALADAVLLERVRFDVVHDGVRAARITTDSTRFSDREVVETEVVARPPRDVVIGARGIAADADGTDE